MMKIKAEIEKAGKRKQPAPFPLSRLPAFRFALL
jgi:hypothetical protein